MSKEYQQPYKHTYLSLNDFNIRSTSTSRWKAEASLLSNFSISSTVGSEGVTGVEAFVESDELFLAEDGVDCLSDMVVADEKDLLPAKDYSGVAVADTWSQYIWICIAFREDLRMDT